MAVLIPVLFGCQAEPPGYGDRPRPGAGLERYASISVCTPPSCAAPPCPADRLASGKPDNQVVDMIRCPTLDLHFGSGWVIATRGKTDIILHLGQVDGVMRVEASPDGVSGSYTLIGFINGTQYNARPECNINIVNRRAELRIDSCHHIPNVRHLRLTRVDRTGSVMGVDAVEATAASFSPNS